MGAFFIGTGTAVLLAIVTYVGYLSFDVPSGNLSDVSTNLDSAEVVGEDFIGE